MSEAQIALLVSLVSLVGQAVNAWLKTRTRADLLEMKDTLLEKMDARYVRKDLCDERYERCRYPVPGVSDASG